MAQVTPVVDLMDALVRSLEEAKAARARRARRIRGSHFERYWTPEYSRLLRGLDFAPGANIEHVRCDMLKQARRLGVRVQTKVKDDVLYVRRVDD